MALSPYLLAAPGAALLATTASNPPDLTGIAAIITAGVGIVGFLATLFRGKQNNKRVEEVEQAASYVKGFDALIQRLQGEVEGLHRDMEAERGKWESERDGLLMTIRTLRTELRESMAENATTKAELVELRGQIKGFLNAQQYEEFKKHL